MSHALSMVSHGAYKRVCHLVIDTLPSQLEISHTNIISKPYGIRAQQTKCMLLWWELGIFLKGRWKQLLSRTFIRRKREMTQFIRKTEPENLTTRFIDHTTREVSKPSRSTSNLYNSGSLTIQLSVNLLHSELDSTQLCTLHSTRSTQTTLASQCQLLLPP